MKQNRLLMLIVTITLMLLVACNSDQASESSDNNSNDTNTSDNNKSDNKGQEEDKPAEITMLANLHTPEVPEPLIEEKLEEATNTKLDIQWVPDANYNEKLNTAFATNTMPDIVGVGATQYDQFKEAIRDGQFWEIGPYIDQFENLSKLNDDILENTTVDGKLYGIYQGRPLSRQGFIFRKDWADNLGIATPTTTDEFYEMARAFTEDDPDGNGKDDTIGLTDRSDLIYGAFKTVSSWFGTPNYWGIKDGEVLPEFMFPEYVDTMNFFKDLHQNGYINQDFPVTSKPDQQAMIKNGTAGIYVGSVGDVGGLYRDGIELDPTLEYDVATKVTGPNSDEFGVWGIPGYGGLFLFPKSAVESEEELMDVLSFFDYLMTPEGANLIFWGIEGKHYEVVDGKAKKIAEPEVTDREVRPYLSFEVGEMATNGKYDTYTEGTYEIKVKANELIEENADYIIYDPTVKLESSTYIEKNERLTQIINDATYQYMLGQIDIDGFNAAIEEWRNNGGDDIIAEFTEHYQSIN